jgi:iron complex transport system substrate-binding protein
MTTEKLLFALSSFLFLFNSCGLQTDDSRSQHTIADKMNPIYAKGFRVTLDDGKRILHIVNPWGQATSMQEIIIQDDHLVLNDGRKINRPVDQIVALSSTQWSAFEKLNTLDAITGISEGSFVQSKAMRLQIANESTIDVGRHGAYKPELIVQLNPELVLYAPEPGGTSPILVKTGIPLLAWPDYFETDPLGRAEWIKVVGILTDKEDEASQLFDSVAHAYNTYRQLVSGVVDKPVLFADKAFSGQWYVPGGKSYMARLFEHAGAAYVWADNPSTASIPFDVETIIAEAWQADYWRIAHAAPEGYSRNNLKQENALYAEFKSFKNNKIIFCNTATSAYFEKGPFEPHLVLADLIHFLHPGLLPDYKPVYHQLLR